MATKNQIIEELYRSKEFNDCISKMEPEHLRDDLRAEVVLILLETTDEKIINLHEQKDALKYYTVRIIMNLIQSKTSKFYKQYRQQLNEINDRFAYDETDIEERTTREEAEEQAMKEIDNLYWYNAGIVKLYMKLGTYRAIKDETGIPFPSVYKTVQKSFKEIREKVLR